MNNNNQNLEHQALSLLASMFYDSGYRRGVAIGTSGAIIGMLIGAGLMLLVSEKVIDHFDKETDSEE